MAQRYNPYGNQGYHAGHQGYHTGHQHADQSSQGGHQYWSQQNSDSYSKYPSQGHHGYGYDYHAQQAGQQYHAGAGQTPQTSSYYQGGTSNPGLTQQAPAQQTMLDSMMGKPPPSQGHQQGGKSEPGTTYSLGPLGATVRLGTLPQECQADTFCLDTTCLPIGGGQRVVMKREVHPSDWASKLGIAGIPVHQVPVANLCARGLSDLGLRRLSNGHETSAVLCYNTPEGVFTQKLLTAIRRADVNLDNSAALYWATHMKTPAPNKYDKGSPLLDPLIAAIVKLLNTGAPTQPAGGPGPSGGLPSQPSMTEGPALPLASQDDRVQKLEAQVQALTAKAGIKMSPMKAPPSQEAPDSEAAAAFRPHSKEAGKSVLDNCQLSSHSVTAVKKWITLLSSTKTNPKISLEDFIHQVETAYAKMKSGHQPNPRELAIRWGLPLKLASAMAEKTALKVAAAAAWLAS